MYYYFLQGWTSKKVIAEMKKLVVFTVLLTVVLIPALIVASKEGEFIYDCFVNHNNQKGKIQNQVNFNEYKVWKI